MKIEVEIVDRVFPLWLVKTFFACYVEIRLLIFCDGNIPYLLNGSYTIPIQQYVSKNSKQARYFLSGFFPYKELFRDELLV